MSATRNPTTLDLSPYLAAKVPSDAKVILLPVDRWVRLGRIWVMVRDVATFSGDSWIRVTCRTHTPPFNWLWLLLDNLFDYGVWIRWWDRIPDTDIVLDVADVWGGREDVVLAVSAGADRN